MPKPIATRSSVAARWIHSWPLAASSTTAPITSHGPGRKIGLKSFRSTTTPDSTLHSAKNVVTAATRRASVRRPESAGPRRPDSTSVDTLLTNEAMNVSAGVNGRQSITPPAAGLTRPPARAIERPRTPRGPARPTRGQAIMRQYMEQLRARGQLLEVRREVQARHELAAVTQAAQRQY